MNNAAIMLDRSAAYLVNVTNVYDTLVLRFSISLGSTERWTQADWNKVSFSGLPLLVSTEQYQAQSSEGYTKVVEESYHQLPKTLLRVSGIQGFPWMKGTKALKAPKKDFGVYVFNPGWQSQVLDDVFSNSNFHCGMAVKKYAQLVGLRDKNSIFFMIGQSDHVKVVSIKPLLGNDKKPKEVDLSWVSVEHQDHERFLQRQVCIFVEPSGSGPFEMAYLVDVNNKKASFSYASENYESMLKRWLFGNWQENPRFDWEAYEKGLEG